MFHAHLQTGFEIWRWVFIILLLICAAVIVGGAVARFWAAAAGGVIAALIVAAIATWGMWPPLAPQYHTVVPYTGVVKAIGSRLLASGTQGGGSTQVFPFQFANGDIRRCDDSRCSLVKTGDTITLLCVRDFQFNAVPGWVCNWGKLGR